MAAMLGVASSGAIADDDDDYEHDDEAQYFVHGAPSNPAHAWILAAGGRIYDNWWEALDREEPEGTHPAYPAAGAQEGTTTWRCKECHGWDYMGVDGVYRSGSHYTGIPGINGAIGMDEATIASTLRSAPHGYTEEMINDEELARLAAFVSRGQVDMSAYINLETRVIIAGDIDHGRAIFQTVCAACHGSTVDVWIGAMQMDRPMSEPKQWPHRTRSSTRSLMLIPEWRWSTYAPLESKLREMS